MQKIKIILVDDNKHFREGLRFYLEKILDFEVINEAENGEEFLKLDNIHIANIVLMDISMPKLNGIEATKLYLRIRPQKIIALTSYQEKAYLQELIEAGFKGCILKKDIYNQIIPAIEKVRNNDIYYPFKSSQL